MPVRQSLPYRAFLLSLTLLFLTSLWGCTNSHSPSYPADRIKESLLEICRKEYGINELEVKIEDTTLGVYFPLSSLFADDLKEAIKSGQVNDLGGLFQPSPEAIDKIENLLFAISRVILSTDRKIDFYVLQVTDIDSTGLQLVLKGYIEDIKRVRIWDISRDEYRKRIVHELHLNQAVIWHRPVRRFFEDLENLPIEDVRQKYFGDTLTTAAIKRLFFEIIAPEDPRVAPKIKWNILNMRSIDLDKNAAVVYAKVRPVLDQHEKLDLVKEDLEYLFLCSIQDSDSKIVRIIPFQYKDANDAWTKISFPKELQIEQNLSEWKEEFYLEPMDLGDFLADQLTRRMQAIIGTDERIQNTFRELKIDFLYSGISNPPKFSVNVQANLRDPAAEELETLSSHEDMLYVLDLASKEFVKLVRGYQFDAYDYLTLNIASEPVPWIFDRDRLELFRRNKLDMRGLLTPV